jgi:hypothetical protein
VPAALEQLAGLALSGWTPSGVAYATPTTSHAVDRSGRDPDRIVAEGVALGSAVITSSNSALSAATRSGRSLHVKIGVEPRFAARHVARVYAEHVWGTNRWIAAYACSWIASSRKSGTISAWSITGPVMVLAALA